MLKTIKAYYDYLSNYIGIYRKGKKFTYKLAEGIASLKGCKKIGSEDLKIALNITNLCRVELLCLYYVPEKKSFEGFMIYENKAENGQEAREILEDIIRDEVEMISGKKAHDEYNKDFTGFTPLIKWVKQKKDFIAINMNYSTENIIASYTAFVKAVPENKLG